MLKSNLISSNQLKGDLSGKQSLNGNIQKDFTMIGGVSDYTELENKPQINGVTLEGNKTPADLLMTTSQITNDGDGTSPFATEEYVEQNGGKIDSISVDGVEQNIDENKNVNIQLKDYAKTEYVDERFDGANKAVSFINYSSMISSLNALNNTEYNVGQNIMIVTLAVPDLWVSEIAETSVDYTYVSDDEFVNDLNTNGSVQVGYYKLSALETQKVDLTDYVKNTDYATSSKGGVIKTSSYGGILVGGDGVAYISPASNANIDAKTAGVNKPIVPANLDYAVKVGLTTNTQEFTADNKKAARDLIGAVGNEDYATQTKAGVLKLGTSATGLQYDTSGYLKIMRASETDINNKADAYKPIVPMHLDYAVKQGLTDSKLEWTEEEKASARNTLGVEENPLIKVNGDTEATNTGVSNVVIGSNAKSLGNTSIAIGAGALAGNQSYHDGSISIGLGAKTTGDSDIAIGSSATVGTNKINGIAIGTSATCNSSSRGISIGYQAITSGDKAIQIGCGLNNNNNTTQFGGANQPINNLYIYQDASHASDGVAGYKELATKEYVDSVSGEVSIDNTTISKNTNDEMQAVGLTDGVNTLTFAEIYEALTIEED